MKSFVNCEPREFMKQAARLREPLVQWINEIGVKEIRARRPEGFSKMKPEERRKALIELGIANMGEILNIALEKNPELTLKVMCLATFTEPEDMDSHPMTEYIAAIQEMLGNEQVQNFFTLYLAPTMKNTSEV